MRAEKNQSSRIAIRFRKPFSPALFIRSAILSFFICTLTISAASSCYAGDRVFDKSLDYDCWVCFLCGEWITVNIGGRGFTKCWSTIYVDKGYATTGVQSSRSNPIYASSGGGGNSATTGKIDVSGLSTFEAGHFCDSDHLTSFERLKYRIEVFCE